jgi:hypothetical protein
MASKVAKLDPVLAIRHLPAAAQAHRADDVEQVLKLVIREQVAVCAGYPDVRRGAQPQQAAAGQRGSEAPVNVLHNGTRLRRPAWKLLGNTLESRQHGLSTAR